MFKIVHIILNDKTCMTDWCEQRTLQLHCCGCGVCCVLGSRHSGYVYVVFQRLRVLDIFSFVHSECQ